VWLEDQKKNLANVVEALEIAEKGVSAEDFRDEGR
jgi:hypothetical protein